MQVEKTVAPQRAKTGGRKAGTPNRKSADQNGAPENPPILPPRARARGHDDGLGVTGSQFPAYRLAKVETLVGYDKNPRIHSPAQIDLLARLITEFGWTNPVLVDGKRGVIAGHGRVLAAKKLGMDVVPTIELSHLSAAQRRAYVIADNQSAVNGASWDQELLLGELTDLKDLGFDLGLTGFDSAELDSLLADGGLLDPGSAEDAGPVAFDANPGDKVCCPSCGYKFATVDKRFREIAGRKRAA